MQKTLKALTVICPLIFGAGVLTTFIPLLRDQGPSWFTLASALAILSLPFLYYHTLRQFRRNLTTKPLEYHDSVSVRWEPHYWTLITVLQLSIRWPLTRSQQLMLLGPLLFSGFLLLARRPLMQLALTAWRAELQAARDRAATLSDRAEHHQPDA